MISAQRAHNSTGGGRSRLRRMLSGNQSQGWWCQGSFNSICLSEKGSFSLENIYCHSGGSELSCLLGDMLLFKPGACTLVLNWSEILRKNTFKIDLQLLWWHNRTRMSGNWMGYFPSSSHTGQDVRIWCVMKLLLLNELLHILWHGARDYVLGFACSKWSLALFPHVKCNLLQSRCLCVCTVVIWQWVLLSCCKGNSACVLS